MYDMRDRDELLEILRRLLNVKDKSRSKLDEAIIKFKAENNLGEGADVGFDVFSAMRKAYLKRIKNERHRTLMRGEQSAEVEALNLMLRRVIPYFTIDIPTPRGSYFGADTEAGVKYLRGVFLLGGEPFVDGELYERMSTELASQKFFDK